MITVKVITILGLKKIMGSGEIEISVPEGTTLADLVSTLVNRWGTELASQIQDPDTGNLRPYIRLMVNGRDIAFLSRMETILQNQDEVLILPPVSGG